MTAHPAHGWQIEPSNDYHLMPVTDRQLQFARALAQRSATDLPIEVQRDRKTLSDWISAQTKRASGPFDNYPSGKQVAYAESISRRKRRPIPHACFRDKRMMSDWIDRNR